MLIKMEMESSLGGEDLAELRGTANGGGPIN